MQSFTCTALLGIPLEGQTTSLTRLSRSVADLSKSLSSLSILSHLRSLNPESTSTLGLGCSAFARHYLRNHFRFLFLGLLRCFTSPRLASVGLSIHPTIMPCYRHWVVPFGHPRIKACLRLPGAYRNLLRPSSPLGTKAFTACT